MLGEMGFRRLHAGVAALLAIITLATTPGSTAQRLKVLPDNKNHIIAVGKSLVLTCQVEAPDLSLATQPRWLNPTGIVIPPSAKVPQLDGERIGVYSEPQYDKTLQMLYVAANSPQVTGNYTCEADYSNLPLRAQVAVMTFVAITFNDAAEFQYATEGDDYKISCTVTALPAPSVDWFKDGQRIESGDRYVIHTNGLEVLKVRSSDEGTYICRGVVLQTGEVADRHIKLEVHTRPEMRLNVSQIDVREGETATLSCKAAGRPPPTYTWVKLSTKENLSGKQRFSVNEVTGVATFSVVADDYGKFVCIATNRAGFSEGEIFVNVLVKPTIPDIQNVSIPIGQDGELEFRALARPQPRIRIINYSTKVTYVEGENNKGRVTLTTRYIPRGDQFETKVVMHFKQVNRTDDGLYLCEAENDAGIIVRKFGHVTVQYPPIFTDVEPSPLWTWGSRTVNITCLAEGIPNATIKWRFRDQQLTSSPQVKIYGSGPLSYVTITLMRPQLLGLYKCIATNAHGEAVHDIEVREGHVPGGVVQVRQEEITATSVMFSIIGPADMDGPPIIAYNVQYKESSNLEWRMGKNMTWSVDSMYAVENLVPMFTYNFRFAAINKVGIGRWGAPTTITMPKSSPPVTPKWRDALLSSTELTHSQSHDSAQIKWRVPANNGEPIDFYEITYCEANKVSGEWRIANRKECQRLQIRSFSRVDYELSGLRPDTRYRVELRAHNILGYSEPAQLYVQTALGVGQDPKSPRQLLSSGAIIGVTVGAVLLCVLIVDLIMFCARRQGIIASMRIRRRPKPDGDDDSKLGSTKVRPPPSPAPLPPPVKLVPTPTDEKEPLREGGEEMKMTSLEYDGNRVYSTTSTGTITGKNSAV